MAEKPYIKNPVAAPDGVFSLTWEQVPEVPEALTWPNALRWMVMVMNHDDPQLSFAASCLSYAVKNDGLTAKQVAACQKLLTRIHQLYENDALDCQFIPPECDGDDCVVLGRPAGVLN